MIHILETVLAQRHAIRYATRAASVGPGIRLPDPPAARVAGVVGLAVTLDFAQQPLAAGQGFLVVDWDVRIQQGVHQSVQIVHLAGVELVRGEFAALLEDVDDDFAPSVALKIRSRGVVDRCHWNDWIVSVEGIHSPGTKQSCKIINRNEILILTSRKGTEKYYFDDSCVWKCDSKTAKQ